MAFTLLTQNQAQITAQNDANIYRMLSMGEDLTFVEDIKLEFSASQVGIKEGYYLVCGRLVKAENTIISIPSTRGVYRLCLRVQPSASAIADRVKLILLDSTQSRSTTDVNGDTASGIYDALLADFDTVTMRFTQRIQYAGVPLIDRVPTATKNSKGTVIAGQNLSIDNQGVLNVVIPKAKANTLGGIKVGSGLSVEDDGTLSANVQEIPKATSSALGGVKIGNGLSVTSDGVLSADVQEIPVASVTTLGGVKIGDGLNITNSGSLFSRVSDVVVKEQEEGCEIVSFDNVVEQKAFTEADITNGYYVYSAGNIHAYSFSIASTDENISDYIDNLNVVAFESLSNMSNPVSIDYRTRSTYVSNIRDYLISIGEDTSDYEGTSYIYFDFHKVPSNCNVIAIEANSVNTLITQTTSSPISIFKSTQNGGAKPYIHYVTSKIVDSIKYNVHSASASGVETRTCEISDNTARAFINKFTTDSSGNLYFNGKKVVLES